MHDQFCEPYRRVWDEMLLPWFELQEHFRTSMSHTAEEPQSLSENPL